MKKLFTSVKAAALLAAATALLLASTPAAHAQLGAPTVVWSSANYTTASMNQNANIQNQYCGTNNVSLNTNVVSTLGKRFLALGFRSQLAASGTTTNTVLVEKSVDGNWWDPYDRIITTSSGTTFIGYVTNYDLGAIPKVRITVLTAAPGTAALTNSTVTVLLKDAAH